MAVTPPPSEGPGPRSLQRLLLIMIAIIVVSAVVIVLLIRFTGGAGSTQNTPGQNVPLQGGAQPPPGTGVSP